MYTEAEKTFLDVIGRTPLKEISPKGNSKDFPLGEIARIVRRGDCEGFEQIMKNVKPSHIVYLSEIIDELVNVFIREDWADMRDAVCRHVSKDVDFFATLCECVFRKTNVLDLSSEQRVNNLSNILDHISGAGLKRINYNIVTCGSESEIQCAVSHPRATEFFNGMDVLVFKRGIDAMSEPLIDFVAERAVKKQSFIVAHATYACSSLEKIAFFIRMKEKHPVFGKMAEKENFHVLETCLLRAEPFLLMLKEKSTRELALSYLNQDNFICVLGGLPQSAALMIFRARKDLWLLHSKTYKMNALTWAVRNKQTQLIKSALKEDPKIFMTKNREGSFKGKTSFEFLDKPMQAAVQRHILGEHVEKTVAAKDPTNLSARKL